jgi:hypothetical protein
MCYIQFQTAEGNWYGANPMSLDPYSAARKTREGAIGAAMRLTEENGMRYRVVTADGQVIWANVELNDQGPKRVRVRPFVWEGGKS